MNKKIEMSEIVVAPTGERVAKLVAVVTSAAPWIGGPITEIVGGVVTNLQIKRVTQFLKDVLDYVEAVHTSSSEDFVKSEDFADIFEKTAQAVADERDGIKRRLFANYILNNIIAPEISYNHRLKCLRLLGQVEIRHIDLIKAFLQTPGLQESGMMIGSLAATIKRRVPHLSGDLVEIIHDTNRLGLTAILIDHMNTDITGGGAEDLENNVTLLGKDLLAFISREERDSSSVSVG